MRATTNRTVMDNVSSLLNTWYDVKITGLIFVFFGQRHHYLLSWKSQRFEQTKASLPYEEPADCQKRQRNQVIEFTGGTKM